MKAPNAPRDAATLILVRFDVAFPRLLMGQRNEGHVFMPNKYVFPGGRVEVEDGRLPLARDADPITRQKLMQSMRGRPSQARARGLAVAAVRETFEETGLLVGRQTSNEAPDISHLVYFARAITPPARSRRFDSRFFVADARAVSNLDAPLKLATPELLRLEWVSMAEALKLDLPSITRDILGLLQPQLEQRKLPPKDCPVTFHRTRGKSWVVDSIAFSQNLTFPVG